jgi:hypothetical protein
MTADGVVVPLTFPPAAGRDHRGPAPYRHDGAHKLAREGRLVRREDATFLLTGDAPGAPAKAALRVVSHRRKLIARK